MHKIPGTTVVIADRKDMLTAFDMANKNTFNSSYKSLTVSEIKNAAPNYLDDVACLVLLDLSAMARKYISNHYLKLGCLTVSFGSCGLYSDDILQRDLLYVPVFCTRNILDIRDASEASPQEVIYLQKYMQPQIKRIDRAAYAMATCPFNASSGASDDELERLRKEMKKAQEQAEYYKGLSIYYQQILSATGIPTEAIDASYARTLEIKKKYNQIDSHKSEGDQEKYLDLIQTEIASELSVLISKYLSPINTDRYDELLRDLFTREIWNRILDESKRYLLTGKITYDMYTKTHNADSLDYSGVCLETTKAFDMEMTERFYTKYITYLQQQRLSIDQLPHSLLNKDKNAIMRKADFTLGSIPYVIGVEKDGTIANCYAYRKFLTYAKTQLYGQNLSESDIAPKIKHCVLCTEKVRRDYRNPAAHRQPLERIKAKECLDYIVDTQQMLKEILRDMKI